MVVSKTLIQDSIRPRPLLWLIKNDNSCTWQNWEAAGTPHVETGVKCTKSCGHVTWVFWTTLWSSVSKHLHFVHLSVEMSVLSVPTVVFCTKQHCLYFFTHSLIYTTNCTDYTHHGYFKFSPVSPCKINSFCFNWHLCSSPFFVMTVWSALWHLNLHWLVFCLFFSVSSCCQGIRLSERNTMWNIFAVICVQVTIEYFDFVWLM